MKITNETIEQLNQTELLTDKSVVGTGLSRTDILELVSGERFTALVMDIKPGNVLLKLSDGKLLDAKSLFMPEAHIGDEATFQVKENVRGQILLEMVKQNEKGASASIVKEALSAAHMQYTKQNAEIVNLLIKANLPIDAQTIQRTAYFKYAEPEFSDKEILFLVKENFPTDEKTIETYKGFMDKTVKLDDNIKLLLSEMEKTEILKAKVPQLRNKLILDLKQNGLKNIGEYFREVEKTVAELKTLSTQYKVGGEVAKQLEYIEDNLKLMDNVSQYKQFMQIPFAVEGRVNQAELHVFSKKKGKPNASDGSATAVLALDYDSLGHVEVVINRINKTVSLQFKGDKSRAIELLQANSPKLIEILNEKGYNIAQIGFKKTEEKFDIADGIELDRQADAADIKRYSFDMRV